MKICTDHWAEMRAAVDARGMAGLVAQSGAAAAFRIQQELEGKETMSTYDPLMSGMWMIQANALKIGGLYMMGQKEGGGEYCPLCEVEKNLGRGSAGEWITGCFDAVLEFCKENKLIDPQGGTDVEP